MIDWDVAISTGTRWARPGPQVSLAEARRTVSELRDLAGAVQQPVYEVTGMSGSRDGALGRVAVVDRPGWIRANVDGFRVVLEPFVEQLKERAPGGAAVGKAGGVMTAVGSRVTGIQAGLILAYLSSRVLGQYELFLPPETSPVNGEQPGRLQVGVNHLLGAGSRLNDGQVGQRVVWRQGLMSLVVSCSTDVTFARCF